MDIESIDREYDALQSESQQTIQALQKLGGKLQSASQAGNQEAREWFLDLRELALAFRSEQARMNNLLQALHGLIVNQQQASYAPPPPQQPSSWTQPVPAQPAFDTQPQQGGVSGFLNSSFGRGIAMGAGFGIADDLIKEIF